MSFNFLNEESGDDESIMADINMTPLIDIMLVLLIIFMVTSSVSVESGLDIELPKSTSSKKPQNIDDVIIVSISKNGEIAVQGKKSDQSSFVSLLQQELGDGLEKTVLFEGDKSTTLDMIISIIDKAKELGAFKFAIATSNN